MPLYQGPETLYYLDPPYPKNTRTAPEAYDEHEMTIEQHEDMLKLVVTLNAKGIYLSTYWNELYNQYLGPSGAGWKYLTHKMPNHSGCGKKKQSRIEVIWYKI
jgi:DNA adenine methylase